MNNNKILQAGRFAIDLSRPQIMGILNVTPDSFSDGGKFNTLDNALKHTEQMLKEGADIIDIGAESSRPGAALVDEKTELERLLPIVEAINKRFDCCISIDTNKPCVMQEVLCRGVSMINDIKGFTAKGALETVAHSDAALCIMHMKGLPKNMQENPCYQDVLTEVEGFLLEQVQKAKKLGIADNRITIDPGFGFGKTPEQNMLLLKYIDVLAQHYPVLFGLSRKSTLGKVLGDDLADRTIASITGALLAVQNGASIVRVHDVAGTVDAIKMYKACINV